MSDQAPDVQDQPQDTTDPEDSGQSEFDPSSLPEEAQNYLSQREKQMTADYTRKTQEAAETRKQAEQFIEALSDPSHPQHKQVLAYFNLEVEADEEDDDDWDDPNDALLKRLDALESRYQQDSESREQRDYEEQEEEYLAEKFEELQGKAGREFDDKELELLFSYAVSNQNSEGLPDVEGAYEVLNGVYDARQKDWISRKKAPRPVGQGSPASRDFDIRDRKARLARSQEIAEAMMSQSSD